MAHVIIQQIIPAPRDCYAVFDEPGDEKQGSKITFERVPCFALVADCIYGDAGHIACERSIGSDRVEPCIEIDTCRYEPASVSDRGYRDLCYDTEKLDSNYWRDKLRSQTIEKDRFPEL